MGVVIALLEIFSETRNRTHFLRILKNSFIDKQNVKNSKMTSGSDTAISIQKDSRGGKAILSHDLI